MLEAMNKKLGAGVTWGLLGAWVLHDLEEVLVAPGWIRSNLPELRRRVPQAPEGLWKHLEQLDEKQFAVAVGVMGAGIAGVAAAGHRSQGRSGMFQTVLFGFGMHGAAHLAQAAIWRGWTPGSATSAVLVVPFSVWARRRLRAAGVLRPTTTLGAIASLPLAAGAVIGAHVVARRITAGRG